MPRCKAPEVLRVASRRIRSNSWHARETVSGPDDVVTNKEQLLARPRDGERAGKQQMAIFEQPSRVQT